MGIPSGILMIMAMTTVKITTELRDRLASVATSDYQGATLADALQRLIEEHEEHLVLAAYARLKEDPEEWASYLDESRLTDNVAGDWLRHDETA